MALKIYGREKVRKSCPSLSLTNSLRAVVRRVRSLLLTGETVYFVGRCYHTEVSRYGVVNKYGHKIDDVRVSPSGVMLQVKYRIGVPISMGWTTLFSTEKLLSESGETLYESPDFEEVVKMMSGDYCEAIVLDILDEMGVIPWERSKAA